MIIDLRTYSVNRAMIRKWFEQHGTKDIGRNISMLALSNHCPIICVCFYMAECAGFIPEIVKIIDSQIAYRGIKKIVNQSEDSIYLHLA